MNRLFRSSFFPLALQLLTLAAFVLLIVGGLAPIAAIVRKLVVAYALNAGWRAATLYLIPGLYGGAFAVMLIVWRLF